MKWVKHTPIGENSQKNTDKELYWNIPDTTNKVLK